VSSIPLFSFQGASQTMNIERLPVGEPVVHQSDHQLYKAQSGHVNENTEQYAGRGRSLTAKIAARSIRIYHRGVATQRRVCENRFSRPGRDGEKQGSSLPFHRDRVVREHGARRWTHGRPVTGAGKLTSEFPDILDDSQRISTDRAIQITEATSAKES
jgi:hypothetical protein